MPLGGSLATGDYQYFFSGLDTDRNWSFSRVYAEWGKSKEVITYANGRIAFLNGDETNSTEKTDILDALGFGAADLADTSLLVVWHQSISLDNAGETLRLTYQKAPSDPVLLVDELYYGNALGGIDSLSALQHDSLWAYAPAPNARRRTSFSGAGNTFRTSAYSTSVFRGEGINIPTPLGPILANATYADHLRGKRLYELKNHLGNVTTVVSDRKAPYFDGSSGNLAYFSPDIASAQDYYPFGSIMPGRSASSGYRYGFNGKEMDEEVKGQGNSLDFGARIYDPRLGRWLSRDPSEAKYPGITPYNHTLNNPMLINDPDGKDGRITIIDNENQHSVTLESTVFLVGKDAEFYEKRLNFTSKTVKVEDPEIKGKIWEVQIKVTYKYSPEIDKKVRELSGGERGSWTRKVLSDPMIKQGPNGIVPTTEFELGDNILRVDNSQVFGQSSAGHTFQGAYYGEVGLGNFPIDGVSTEDFIAFGLLAINHEVSHELGFDERYFYSRIGTSHPGYLGDYLGRGGHPLSYVRQVFEDAVVNAELKNTHYVDLLDFVLQRNYPKGKTVALRRTGDDATTLNIDNTSHGSRNDTEEELSAKTSRIKE